MLREIVEDNETTAVIDSNIQKYELLQEAWDGLKWLLARVPEEGKKVAGEENLYIYKVSGSAYNKVPTITILYSFNENQVEIKATRLTDAEDRVTLQLVTNEKETA